MAVVSLAAITIVCFFPYSIFVRDAVDRRVVYRAERAGAASKISRPTGGLFDSSGKNLERDEYRELMKSTRFPDVPDYAEDISYSYVEVDSFLGDYTFTLCYEVPPEQMVIDGSPDPDPTNPGNRSAEDDAQDNRFCRNDMGS